MGAAYIIKFLNSVGAPDMAEEVAAMRNRLEAFSFRLDVAAMDCATKAAEEAIKQRDVLLDEVAKLKADLHEVQQRRHDEYRVRAIGKAVYRAPEELPEGFDLHIELEKGAGTVRLYDQDGDEVTEEFNGDCLNHDIDNAINYAIASVKGGAA